MRINKDSAPLAGLVRAFTVQTWVSRREAIHTEPGFQKPIKGGPATGIRCLRALSLNADRWLTQGIRRDCPASASQLGAELPASSEAGTGRLGVLAWGFRSPGQQGPGLLLVNPLP